MVFAIEETNDVFIALDNIIKNDPENPTTWTSGLEELASRDDDVKIKTFHGYVRDEKDKRKNQSRAIAFGECMKLLIDCCIVKQNSETEILPIHATYPGYSDSPVGEVVLLLVPENRMEGFLYIHIRIAAGEAEKAFICSKDFDHDLEKIYADMEDLLNDM